ncbi:MAG: Ig-like domain-containing protein [Pseudomonadota bacterium]
MSKQENENVRSKRWLGFAIVCGLVFAPLAATSDTTTYTYDSLGRLVDVEYDDGSSTGYQYDAAGNRTAITSGAGANSPPVAVDDGYNLAAGSTHSLNVRSNDTDPDGDTILITSSQQGTITGGGTAILYTAPTSSGFHLFDYTISDGNGGTDTGSVAVYVAGGGGGF